MARFVLVHSPLVGPTTWSPVADVLAASGHDVTVPSLVGMADAAPPRWQSAVEAVVTEANVTVDQLVLVGHSGSGLLLPAIGDALGDRVRAYLFVEAALPPPEGDVDAAPPWLVEHLRTLADDGRLPPWSQWWGKNAMEELVPDEELRLRLEAEMPRLPVSYFDEGITVPSEWGQTPAAYLQFSDVYDDEAEEARVRGFVVETMPSGHLHMVVDPARVSERMVALCGVLGVTNDAR